MVYLISVENGSVVNQQYYGVASKDIPFCHARNVKPIACWFRILCLGFIHYTHRCLTCTIPMLDWKHFDADEDKS